MSRSGIIKRSAAVPHEVTIHQLESLLHSLHIDQIRIVLGETVTARAFKIEPEIFYPEAVACGRGPDLASAISDLLNHLMIGVQ